MSRFQRYLSREIEIDYKACVYFFAIVFYYAMCRVLSGDFNASILHLTEVMVVAYVMGYVQVYLLRNFDAGEHFGLFEAASALGCTVVYTAGSWFLGWFESAAVTAGFFAYMLFLYGCVFVSNKIKRDIDTKILNDELERFKQRGKEGDYE